jgi:GNAT superfamily N-acetyltransferase
MSAIRRATAADMPQVFELARQFATSFQPERTAFAASFRHLITQDDALLLVIAEGGEVLGYLLAFDHYALFANGRAAWVEEIVVREDRRGRGHGRALMAQFEQWAKGRGATLAALATRRAAGFYRSLGYEESATYFRKLL